MAKKGKSNKPMEAFAIWRGEEGAVLERVAVEHDVTVS